jgi:NO-binding membrane sensor protein with MHYT domain
MSLLRQVKSCTLAFCVSSLKPRGGSIHDTHGVAAEAAVIVMHSMNGMGSFVFRIGIRFRSFIFFCSLVAGRMEDKTTLQPSDGL